MTQSLTADRCDCGLGQQVLGEDEVLGACTLAPDSEEWMALTQSPCGGQTQSGIEFIAAANRELALRHTWEALGVMGRTVGHEKHHGS